VGAGDDSEWCSYEGSVLKLSNVLVSVKVSFICCFSKVRLHTYVESFQCV
jgi:hypothetical protein